MAKEHFFYGESQSIFAKLEQLARRSGVSRGQAFEDFLTAMVCALAGETMEDEYLAMVERHKDGKPGKRGVDLLPIMFAELIHAMEETDADILGDIFQGAITYGEAGQYFTPESLSRLLAQLTVEQTIASSDEKTIPLINDPACGTGRMLLEASQVNPHAELVGQDIDARCANITAINLGLRGKYGWVVCGNTLTGETQFAYRIGSFYNDTPNGLRRGVIRAVPPESTPVPVIAERLRHKAADLLEEQKETESAFAVSLPTIVEVPHWLARLEPQLVGRKSEQQEPQHHVQPVAAIADSSKEKEGIAKQRELF